MARTFRKKYGGKKGYRKKPIQKMSNQAYPIYKPLKQNMVAVKIKSVVDLGTLDNQYQVPLWFGVEGHGRFNGEAAYSGTYSSYASRFNSYAGVYEEYTITFLKVKVFPISKVQSAAANISAHNAPYHTSIEPDLATLAAMSAENYDAGVVAA